MSNNLLSRITLDSPETFVKMGLRVEDPYTLVDTPEHKALEAKVDELVRRSSKLQQRPPRAYQKRYAAMAALRDNNLLAHDPGSGKTYETALLIMILYSRLRRDGGVDWIDPNLGPGTIQITAPKHTLKKVWLTELAQVGLVELDQHKNIIGGYVDLITSEKEARLSKKPIWVYHYDFTKKQSARGKQSRRSNNVGHPLFKLLAKQFPAGLLITDEVHMLRTGTDRTRALFEVRKKALRCTGLTGTPMDGWVAHLATILGFIFRENSPEFPMTIAQFTRQFTRKEINTRSFVSGEEDRASAKKRPAPGIATDQLAAFHKLTRHLVHRLTFKDPEVIRQVKFPAMDHRIVRLDMDPAHAAYYQRVHTDMMRRIADAIAQMDAGKVSRGVTRDNVLSHLNVLRAAASHPWDIAGFQPLVTGSTAKIRAAVELAKQVKSEGRKILFFTNRVAVGNKLTDALRHAGVGVVRVYDTDPNAKPKKLNQDQRDERIEQFQTDPATVALVGNLRLMSTGLTLVEASYVCHVDHDWPSNQFTQGNHRVVRPGQTYDPVPVYCLLLNQTVDGYVHAGMLNKAIATAQTIDNEFDTSESSTVDPIDVARALLNEEQSHDNPEGGPDE
jgi:SNF2 family DNA or RNA helicase